MAEIFGRAWYEQFGEKPPQQWCEEIGTWSVELAAAVLYHYRRAGLRWPPNLSEIARTANELRPGLEPPPAKPHFEPNALHRARLLQQQRDTEWIEKYLRDHPGASYREAAMALLKQRGQTSVVPEHILQEERAREAERLRKEATVEAARAHDFEDALEHAAEREAIQSEGMYAP